MIVETNAAVVQVQISAVKREPMVVLDAAVFKAGHGIEGDRHAGGNGGSDRQVLMMDAETQTELGIDPAVTRENVTTTGLDLTALTPGKRVRFGSTAVVEITGDCDPCANLDAVRAGLRDVIQGRRGVLGKIVTDGTVHPGDSISVD
jgi:MOSC domain-containing protein YiiM